MRSEFKAAWYRGWPNLAARSVVAVSLFPVAIAQDPLPTTHAKVIHSFPLSKFYDTPGSSPTGKPGELIRSAPFDEYHLPGDVSAVRILYHSRSVSNEDVVASGVVLFPDKKAPAGGWPIIAWAHDLNGVARSCAPSLARNLRHGSFLSMYVQLGYAVVASDYTGLGSNFRNAFADMNSNAMNVIDSVAAARKAVPQLDSRWIAMGTGEGAAAVVAVAQIEVGARDLNYRGSISLSPLTDLSKTYEHVNKLPYQSPLFMVYGIQTLYPKFQPSDILTPAGLSLYSRIGTACNVSASEISPAEMLKPEWDRNPFVLEYFARNRPGLISAQAPMLVLTSQADPHHDETARMVTRLCAQGDKIDLESYPGNDPGTLIGDSVRDQIGWIQAVFGNRTVRNNCASQH